MHKRNRGRRVVRRISRILWALLRRIGLWIDPRDLFKPGPRSGKAMVSRYTLQTYEPRLLLSADLGYSPAHLFDVQADAQALHFTQPSNSIWSGDEAPVVRFAAFIPDSYDSLFDPYARVLASAAPNPTATSASEEGLPTRRHIWIDPSVRPSAAPAPAGYDSLFGPHAQAQPSAAPAPADADGTEVEFVLTGPGSVQATPAGDAFDLALTGTTTASTLTVNTTGGDGLVTLRHISIDGALGSFNAANADLTGNLIAQGALGTLSLHSWLDADATPNQLQAVSIGTLAVTGDFDTNVQLSGAASGFTLGVAHIGGVASGLWNIVGRSNQLYAGSTGPGWAANFSGALSLLSTTGNLSGQLSSPSIRSIQVGGNLDHATLLAGADLGADAALGGTGADADQFSTGTLAQLRVGGAVNASRVRVGVDPVDAILDNGNDTILGGSASRIRALRIDGTLSADSSIVAGAFPARVRVNGQRVDPQTLAQLSTVPLDLVAPALAAALANDSGRSATDRLTNDPGVSGLLTDAGTLQSLLAGLDAMPAGAYVDVLAERRPDGSFSLDRARLEAIAGSALADGTHTLHLRATDASGNLTTFDLAFTLDTTAPAAPVFGLAPSSDTGAAGDGRTGAALVTLLGNAEEGSQVTLQPANLQALAGVGGVFQLANVALAIGENTLSATTTDAAGNTSLPAAQTLVREDGPLGTDAVATWHAEALATLVRDAEAPPAVGRTLAIESLAVLDVINAFEGTPSFAVSMAAPAGASLDAAIAGAAHRVLSSLYPAQRQQLDAALAASLAAIPDGRSKTDGLAFGQALADAIVASRAHDGYKDFVDYPGSTALGAWRPTGPSFELAALPQWADVMPFVLTSPDALRPAAPPALDTAAYGADVEEVRRLGNAGSAERTPDQTETVHFWADGPGTSTPSGHWNQIAAQIADAQGLSAGAKARLFAELNVALADAGVAAWDAKYSYGLWRPETAIANAAGDGNDATQFEANWRPRLITPNHPEYVSGHSTYSAAAAEVLASVFGENFAFDAVSPGLPGVTRNFTSFEQAAEEAGRSRVFGGIHFEFTNQAGQQLGRQVAGAVLARFALAEDTQGPTIALDDGAAATATNPTITGRVLDNLSGVVSLEAQIDPVTDFEGEDPPPPVPVIPVSFDAQGRFSLSTALALDGSADGLHRVTFTARDAAGNVSPLGAFSFTLDTRAPTIDLTSPATGASLGADTRIQGSAAPTGSTLIALSYSIDAGTPQPLIFDAVSGSFDAALALRDLAPGSHTLTLSARDAAGNTATLARDVQLDTYVPFTLTRVTPEPGSDDVGATFRPQVFFSRAVDAATLTADTFYATDTTGDRLAAEIVIGDGGHFAWLFFTGAMPGASTITVHLKGTDIHATGDGQALDADGDGTPDADHVWRFSTVSLAGIPGTILRGKVVDPGPDYAPMTFDDFRRGPDGIPYTADDVFLSPLAHVEVSVLGRPDLHTVTDTEGNFELTNLPAGNIKLVLNGRTATNAEEGFYFPEMTLDLTLEAGLVNTVMGSMGSREERAANEERTEVYLPRLRSDILQAVDNTQAATITLDPASTIDLTPEQIEQLKLEFQPGSLIGEDGKPMASAEIGISTVPPELVRDMLPPGVLQHTFDITIQAPGVAAFATPLEISFPNVFNAAPGTKLNFLSFDHTTGKLVIEGTATVSEDGLSVVTDPGMGITKPGWHGLAAILAFLDFFAYGECTDANIQKALANARAAESIVASLSSTGAQFIEHFINGSGVPIDSPPGIVDEVRTNSGSFDEYRQQVRQYLDSAIASYVLYNGIPDDPTKVVIANYSPSGSINFEGPNPPYFGESNELFGAYGGTRGTIAGFQFTSIDAHGGNIYYSVRVYNLIHDEFVIDRSDILGNAFLHALIFLQECGIAKQFTTDIGFEERLDGVVPDPLSATLAQLKLSRAQTAIPPSGGRSAIDMLEASAYRQTFSSSTYFRYVLSTGSMISGVADGTGSVAASLPPLAEYTLYIYNPGSDKQALINGQTGASGSTIHEDIALIGGTSDDSDNDGLSDFGEFTIGTSPQREDTDADGLTDLAELAAGLDPLGGRSLPTGIVASLPLQGESKAVTLEGSTQNAETQTAYIATGSYGLAIVDASNFQQPIVLGQLDLSGDAVDVAIDPRAQVAVVAAGTALHFIDVSDPTRPVLTQTITIPATQVEVADGVAYVASGNGIEAYSVASGELLQVLALGAGNVTSLAREGATLYALDAIGVLRAIDIGGLSMSVLGSLAGLPTAKVFVGNGIAYVGAGDGNTGGFATADVSNPAAMVLLSGVDANNIQGQALAVNGSGLAVSVGNLFFFGQGNVSSLDVIDVRDPTNTGRFLTNFRLPAPAQDVAIGAGLAFVAGGSAGLQVVNYLAFDNQGQAPTLSVSADGADVDPITPGIQTQEGTLLRLTVQLDDDVQVRNVEVLVDGVVQTNDVQFPWDPTAALPTLSAGATQSTIQVRATDTGGNVTLSNALVVDLVPDVFGPTITGSNLVDGSLHGSKFRTIRIAFSEAMDPATLNAQNFRLLDALGQAVTPDVIEIGQTGTIVQFTFPMLQTGTYSFVIDQAAVTDRAGNALGSAELSLGAFEIVRGTIEWVNRTGGDWNNPANWDEGRLPDVDDDVIVDALPGAVVTFSSGSASVRNLVTNVPFQISGGTIAVSGEWSVAAPISATGGIISNSKLTGSATLTVQSGRTLTLQGVTLGVETFVQNSGSLHMSDGVLTLDEAAVHLQGAYGGNFRPANLDFEGMEVEIKGVGGISFEGDGTNYVRPITEGATLTIGAGITVSGPNGGVVGHDRLPYDPIIRNVVNRGRIVADTGGISVLATEFRNEGTLQAINGAQLYTYSLTNAATGLLAMEGATSNFYLDNLSKLEGDVSFGSEGILRVRGTLDLQGHTLSAGAVLSTEYNPTIINGRLDGEAAYRVVANHTLYLDRTVTVGADITVAESATLYISGGVLTLDEAVVHLQGAYGGNFRPANLDFEGMEVEIKGVGGISFEGDGTNYVRPITEGATLTIGAGITVSGPNGGVVGHDRLPYDPIIRNVVNRGRIVADTGGISVLATEFRNEGTLQAINGAQLYTYSLTNAATGLLAMEGATSNFYLDNLSKLEGDVSFGSEGILRVRGTLDLQGHTLSAGAVLSTEYNPTIINGRLDGEAAYRVVANHTLYLDRTVTVGADITVAESATLYISGGVLTLDEAVVHLQGAYGGNFRPANLDFEGMEVEIKGVGGISFEGDGTNYVRPITEGATLTIGAGITVSGPNGGVVGHDRLPYDPIIRNVVNRGRIVADTGGISVLATEFRNEGTLQAINGAQLYTYSLTNAATGLLAMEGATSNFYLDNLSKLEGDVSFGSEGILRVRGTLDLQGHTLSAGAVLSTEYNPTIINGRLDGEAAYRVVANHTLYLDRTVTVGADITVAESATLYISGGVLTLDEAVVHLQGAYGGNFRPANLDFEGMEVEIKGVGGISFEGDGTNYVRPITEGATLTIGAGITVSGPNGGVVGHDRLPYDPIIRNVVNRGRIVADTGGISVLATEFRNEGTLQAINGAQLYTYSLTNAATGLLAMEGATSNFYLDNLSKLEGDVSFGSEGILRVRGTLDLQGHTLSAGAVLSTEYNPTIINGRLDGEAAYRVVANHTLYLDRTVTVGADITVAESATLYISGGVLTLDEAVVHLQGAYGGNFRPANLDFEGMEVEIKGVGGISFEGDGTNYVRPITEGATLTIGAGITVSGPNGGVVGHDRLPYDPIIRNVVNRGRIVADTGGISVLATEFRNEGTLQAINGAQLYTYSLTNAATGLLAMEGATSNFYLDNLSKLEGDVSFGSEGILRVRGTLDLQGHTLSAGAVLSTEYNPTIINGRLDGDEAYRVGAGRLLYLDSTVTVGADITVANSARLYVTGVLRLDGAVVHMQGGANQTYLDFEGAAPELLGIGSVSFEGAGNNYVRPITANGVLTIGSGITITGPMGGVVGYSGFNGGIVNKGRIVADAGGVSVQAASVTNEGEMRAAAGHTLSLTNLLNAGRLIADVGGVVSIAGALTNTAVGVVEIGIEGTAANEFGRIDVAGLAALDGTIKTTLLGGFVPAIGQTFRVLSFGSSTGSFATVVDGNPGDGVGFGADYDATGLTLRAIPEAVRRALPSLTGSRWLLRSDGTALPETAEFPAAKAMARSEPLQGLTAPRAPASIGPPSRATISRNGEGSWFVLEDVNTARPYRSADVHQPLRKLR